MPAEKEGVAPSTPLQIKLVFSSGCVRRSAGGVRLAHILAFGRGAEYMLYTVPKYVVRQTETVGLRLLEIRGINRYRSTRIDEYFSRIYITCSPSLCIERARADPASPQMLAAGEPMPQACIYH